MRKSASQFSSMPGSDVGARKLGGDVGRKESLESSAVRSRSQRPVVVELDPPLEDAAQRDELRVVVERELGEDDLAAPEGLGDVRGVPPELLDDGAILRFRRRRSGCGLRRSVLPSRQCARPCRGARGSRRRGPPGALRPRRRIRAGHRARSCSRSSRRRRRRRRERTSSSRAPRGGRPTARGARRRRTPRPRVARRRTGR